MKRTLALAVFVLASACPGASATSDTVRSWCETHQAEVLLASQVDDPDEAARLIEGASRARLALRMQAESEFLLNNPDLGSDRLDSMRRLEAYAEGAESDFSGFEPAEWTSLVNNTDRYQQACSFAHDVHLFITRK